MEGRSRTPKEALDQLMQNADLVDRNLALLGEYVQGVMSGEIDPIETELPMVFLPENDEELYRHNLDIATTTILQGGDVVLVPFPLPNSEE